MAQPKWVFLNYSFNDNVRFKYRLIESALEVKITKAPPGMQHLFIADCINEAYEDYNAKNKDNQIIHPSAIVEPDEK